MKIGDRVKPATPPIPAGTYLGVCIGVIDLGEQYSEKFKSYSNQVQFVFEVSGQTIEVDGKTENRQLSSTFSVSSKTNSKIRKFLTDWNGKPYSDDDFIGLELFDQIGKPAILNVVLNDTGEYSNIANCVPLIAGMPAPAPTLELIRWDMDAWDDAAFEKLPGWAQEKIRKSTQFQKQHTPTETIQVQPTQPTQSVNDKALAASLAAFNGGAPF